MVCVCVCVVQFAHFRQKYSANKSEIETLPIRMQLTQKSLLCIALSCSRSHRLTERQTTVIEKREATINHIAHVSINKLPITGRIQNALSFHVCVCSLYLHATIAVFKLEEKLMANGPEKYHYKRNVIFALSANTNTLTISLHGCSSRET